MDLGRTEYLLLFDDRDRQLVDAACAVLFDAIRPSAVRGILDGFAQGSPPESVRQIESELASAFGSKRAGLRFDLQSPAEEARFRAFAPWSIHVDVFGESARPIGTIHDGGWSVHGWLTHEEVSQLGRLIEERSLGIDVVALAVHRERVRRERRTGRRERIRRVWSWRRS